MYCMNCFFIIHIKQRDNACSTEGILRPACHRLLVFFVIFEENLFYFPEYSEWPLLTFFNVFIFIYEKKRPQMSVDCQIQSTGRGKRFY